MSQQYYYKRKVKEVLQAVLSVVVPGQEEVRSAKSEPFFCDIPGCMLTFGSENEAQAHMDTGICNLV